MFTGHMSTNYVLFNFFSACVCVCMPVPVQVQSCTALYKSNHHEHIKPKLQKQTELLLLTWFFISLLFYYATPSYNHNGWLGVKHHVTYLCTAQFKKTVHATSVLWKELCVMPLQCYENSCVWCHFNVTRRVVCDATSMLWQELRVTPLQCYEKSCVWCHFNVTRIVVCDATSMLWE